MPSASRPAVPFIALAIACLPASPGTAAAQEESRGGEIFFEESVELGGATILRISLHDADVLLRPSADGAVAVRARVWSPGGDRTWARSVAERMALRLVRAGDAVIVHAEPADLRPSEWRDHRGVSVALEITHPRAIDVELETEDGDVRIEGVEGRLSAHTADGDLRIGVAYGPEVRLTAADGDVEAERIEAGRVWVETGDGDILARSVSGALEARTGDGDILVGIGTDGDVSVWSDEGHIVIHAPAALAADLHLRGEEVRLDLAFRVEGTAERREVRGKVGRGDRRVAARTGEGVVALRAGPPPPDG